jgi:CRP/FNR family transcriptional regulator, cyclic AMP receptor protein
MIEVTTSSLAAHPFLRGIPAERLAGLAGAASVVVMPGRHRIFERGGNAAHFWLIRSGSVALDLDGPGRGLTVLETVGMGEALGLSWLSAPYQWVFGAQTTEPTEAFQFDARAVRAQCDTDPALGYELTRRFVAAATDRLQAARFRLTDLYAQLDAGRQPEVPAAITVT